MKYNVNAVLGAALLSVALVSSAAGPVAAKPVSRLFKSLDVFQLEYADEPGVTTSTTDALTRSMTGGAGARQVL